VLIVAVAVACPALVAFGLSLCRLAARSEVADAAAVASRLGAAGPGEPATSGDGGLIEPQRTRATRGL
jgi:hypothetical protein